MDSQLEPFSDGTKKISADIVRCLPLVAKWLRINALNRNIEQHKAVVKGDFIATSFELSLLWYSEVFYSQVKAP